MREHQHFYIGGQFQKAASEARRAFLNPAMETVSGWIAMGNATDVDRTVAAAPFGGYKVSGDGREWGGHGFAEYLETKAVLGYAPAVARAG